MEHTEEQSQNKPHVLGERENCAKAVLRTSSTQLLIVIYIVIDVISVHNPFLSAFEISHASYNVRYDRIRCVLGLNNFGLGRYLGISSAAGNFFIQFYSLDRCHDKSHESRRKNDNVQTPLIKRHFIVVSPKSLGKRGAYFCNVVLYLLYHAY